ncbi:outer membrane autotransporter barrel domain-containing protein [Pandoraea horticolens]|uniref:Outer membrane autotransporter barrel domain-containing protein n=1 Tax=Pandoraea horticolens TaxID=2508298 RepID=A0A5E4XSF8_9BURK|nr:autotransporter outer membrane beta-barrel domain-containing protein [Pandoraea horticolens]VVE39307.1 outer membrane autotransporter barrel domain-containing protein [Pandoraea horticolens]
MNTPHIDAGTAIQSTNDTLAARVRRTAIAGAAALALTGGGMVSANAASEMVSETSAAERNWKRIADAAANPAVLSFDRGPGQAAKNLDKARANPGSATMAPAIAKVSKVPSAVAKSVGKETHAVVLADASGEDWRKWLNDKTREIKDGAEKIAEIVELSEHATDKEKETTREVLSGVIENLGKESDRAKRNEGDDGDKGDDGNLDEVSDGDAEEPAAVEPPVELTETETDAEEVTQPTLSAEQAMASGVVLTQMANAAQQNAELFRKGMQDRLSGDDAFMQPTDIGSTTAGISTWAQAMGAQTTGRGRDAVPGFSLRGAGMVVGVDAKKNNTRVGIAVGYGDASVDANGESSQKASSKVSTYSVGLYGAHEVDGWFANGGVSYSAHSIKSQRAAKLGGEVYGLSGKTNATTVGGFAQFGKHIVTRAVNIDPSITLKVSNTSVKGFTENGDAGLKVDGSNFNSARVGMGARLWKAFGDEAHSVTPSLRISYERELAHAAPSMDVALANAANAGTMTVTGNKLGRDIVGAEAAVDVKLGKKLSLRGGVNGSVRQGQTQAGVAGSLKYVW